MSTYLGLIPARAGSKGIPRKNMVLLGSKPLLQYTIEAAQNSQRLDRILFTSDDQEMITTARNLGVDAPFQRPADLATDSASSIDVAFHALDWLRREQGYEADAVVLLQPTGPFRDGPDIDAAIATYEASGRESLASVNVASEHPCELVTLEDGRLRWAVPHPALGRLNRQSFPQYYFINGAIHIATERFLVEQRTFYNEDSAICIMDRAHGIDIDDDFALEFARGLLAARSRGT